MAVIENHHLFLTLLVFSISIVYGLKPETILRHNEMCKKFAVDPYFETEMVVGKPWRIYYTWNMKLENKCLDMVFKNATPRIIQRIWNDMYEYLEQQPAWDAATLHATMGRARHEILMFAEQGPAGSFTAVPNVIRDGNISPTRSAVPLLKFQLKLVRNGKFLIMMDCQMGVSSLSARSDHPPYRSEILAATAHLDLGDGFPSCVSDKNKDERFLVK
ncbi:uncharacterized protein LOC135082309 [Ostrinia nubilalis]|uniref:uncharacterized protein LOC135082309 n=1 Tax=Ostrinia nubilalis TaxID=29057 RepID=UPI0030826A43